MSDIIEDAINSITDETERTAQGKINGHEILVKKEQYKQEQLKPSKWRFAVYVDDDGPTPTRQKKDLTASEAQSVYDTIISKYDQLEEK